MRVSHGLFAALFLLAAGVNLNDPDPARWIGIYLAAAVLSAATAAGARWPRWPAAVVGGIALIWGLTYLPAVLRHGQVLSMFDEWSMRNQEVLENREMFGLLIVSGWMVAVMATSRHGTRR